MAFPFLFYITIGVIGYICFIIEHKRKIIINKNNNKFLIVEKALFRNCYKILKNINLDMVENAVLAFEGVRNQVHVWINGSFVAFRAGFSIPCNNSATGHEKE